MNRWWSGGAAALLCLGLAGCDSVDAEGETRCGPGEQENPVSGECSPVLDVGGQEDAEPEEDADEGPFQDYYTTDCGAGNSPTRISGVVTIPSGELPLPGVAVYVPRSEPRPIEQGASCEPCAAERSSDHFARAQTNIQGEFLLVDVPAGQNVPLVLEVGKWRRQVEIPVVEACENNNLSGSDLLRLPRNRQEGEIPQIAVTTGEFDALECLLRKIGIDDEEFSTDSGDGTVHLFAGRGGTNRFASNLQGGASFTSAFGWWNELDNLLDYDIVLHSCEGNAYMNDKSEQARQALLDFTEAGGRVFLSHWHNVWLRHGPADFQAVANWMSTEAITGMNLEPDTGFIVTDFDKGLQLQEWMVATGTQPRGQFPINETRGSIESLNEQYATEWVWIEPEGFNFDMPGFPGGDFGDFFPDPPDELTQYFSFNTPIQAAPEEQCGRVVFSDIHVAAGSSSSVDHPFPSGCTTGALTPQEKALTFMLFDLSRCIIPDKGVGMGN